MYKGERAHHTVFCATSIYLPHISFKCASGFIAQFLLENNQGYLKLIEVIFKKTKTSNLFKYSYNSDSTNQWKLWGFKD